MAKKKNISKKHKFKHVETSHLQAGESATTAVSEAVESNGARPAALKTAPVLVSGRDFSYIAGDLRRIALMGGSLIAVELVLYYLLVHTPVGPAVYSLVRI